MAVLSFYPRFHDSIRQGIKTHTLRSKAYGEAGDVVPSSVGALRLIAVTEATPAWVRDNLWREEGCSSPEDFEAVWLQIHPRAPAWDRPRFLHHFEPRSNLDDETEAA